MRPVIFPDNTVLINFALIGRLDLLERLVRGRARWTATVARECARSALQEGLQALHGAPDIFGTPLYLETAKEIVDTEAIRARMAGPGDGPNRHLGEAEAIAIIAGRLISAAFVTDDREAGLVAAAEGITTLSTCELLRAAVRRKLLTAAEAWAAVVQLRHAQRRLLHSPRFEADYMRWCSRRRSAA